jgi:hypothetical protein
MSVEYLKSNVPDLDEDNLQYIVSIADEESLSQDEKIDAIAEHLAAISDSEVDSLIGTVREFSKLHTEEKELAKKPLAAITAQAVAACIDVIRTSAPTVQSDEEEPGIDDSVKKELLRRYDADIPPPGQPVQKKKGSATPTEDLEEDEEIYGLGANENKLRKIREREEMRARAKQEQEEARVAKVQQKLKLQGSQIKDKSVNRKK